MLLAIDIGNSSTKIGVFENALLTKRLTIPTIRSKTADEIYDSLQDEIKEQFSALVVASVVPELNAAFSVLGEKYFNQTPFFVDNRLDFGLEIKYFPPENLGIDRLVSRVAADAMVKEVEVWSVRVAGWSTAAAQAIAASAEVLAVPDRAFDGAALLVSLPQGGRIDEVTAALVEASASVRASTLVGSHAGRYRLEGAGLEHPAKHSSGA